MLLHFRAHCVQLYYAVYHSYYCVLPCTVVYYCVLLGKASLVLLCTVVYDCVLLHTTAYYCVLVLSIYHSDLQLSMLVGFRPWSGHKEGMISGKAAAHAEHDRHTEYRRALSSYY